MTINWYKAAPKAIDEVIAEAALKRQNELTKPQGSLGELEALAVFLASRQLCQKPCVDKVWISIFAGDHGIVAEGVSAFPQAVTAEMVRNFVHGGAAISVLARQLAAHLDVVNLGTVSDISNLPKVRHAIIAPSTANFAHMAAMSEAQCLAALDVGRQCVKEALNAGYHLFIGGEMGIGNTSSAAALACALLHKQPEDLAGPGTGLDHSGVTKKAQVIARALAQHQGQLNDPLTILRYLGGFEIAALTGAYLACAQNGIVALVDGFITTSAALLAERINPGSARWFLYGHASAEPGHRYLLEALNATPVLRLNLRLGEGSGAATAVPLLRLACALHNEMASFAEAAVSGQAH